MGQGEDLDAIKAKALRTGASVAVVDDLQERFVREFIPAVRAGALYEGKYPLHTALGRPLLAQRLVEVALEHGAEAQPMVVQEVMIRYDLRLQPIIGSQLDARLLYVLGKCLLVRMRSIML